MPTATTKRPATSPARRKPADHKPKTPTKSGVDYAGRMWRVAPDVFDDFELMDRINEIDSGQPQKLPALLRDIFGDEYPDVLEAMRPTPGAKINMEAAAIWVKGFIEAVVPNS